MAKQINARIMTKHDVAENWEKATTFVPKEGEIIIYEVDGKTTASRVPRLKVGDGSNKINDLKFITEPYVLKKSGYGLSKNDFTDAYKSILEKMGDNPSFTDTTYESGEGIELKNNKFYNLGLISVNYNKTTPSLDFKTYNTQSNSYQVKAINLKTLFNDTFEMIQNSSTPIFKSGSKKGTLSVNGKDIAISGLGELAFLNTDYIIDNLSEINEIEITSGTTPTNGAKIWINISNKTLYYRASSGSYISLGNNSISLESQQLDEKSYLIRLLSSEADVYEFYDKNFIDELKARILKIENVEIQTIKNNISSLTNSITNLQEKDQVLENNISSLTNSITKLQEKDQTLENNITNITSLLKQKATIKKENVTLSTSNWVSSGDSYTQTVTVTNNIDANTDLIITPEPSSHVSYWFSIVRATSQNGKNITFTAKEKPEEDLIINIMEIFQG